MAESQHKGVPLRDWNSASYDPMTGRAAKSTEAAMSGQQMSAEGLSWSVSDQLKAGANGTPSGHGTSMLSWAEIDRNRSRK